MKQGSTQSVDAYMSQLRLALPECKYKHDKDQFIFGLHNKEIQDRLLGELSGTDNSIRALYEARKIKSKLEQQKMLGTVTPNYSLVGMDAIRKNRFSHEKCDFCGWHHKKGKQHCLAFGKKNCDKCGGKIHSKAMCRSSKGLRKRSDRTKKCMHRCDIDEVNECCDDNTMVKDLTDQVQSLFYH